MFRALSLLSLSLIVSNAATANQAKINIQIQKLENSYKALSSLFYTDSKSYSAASQKEITDIDELLLSVTKLNDANQSIAAIQLIYFNIQTVKDNIDTKAVFQIVELLLDKNEWNLANTLFKEIKNEGDKSLLATIQFIFAKYHAQRNEWPQVNKLLDGFITELSEENAGYALLLNGSALQHLKKHRQAVENYKKVKPTSQYYSYAQLNTAIANIRQGWWTDAQTKIQDLIVQYNKTNEDELTNRLYLVLGYALLQREYYRDARESFRNIGLESRYTNRALLGIGLTATSQGDYVGGLNALTILKNKKTSDLSVDESYLLVPYVYEKLQQELTVTTTYTEAMNYYQRRTANLKDISNKKSDFSKLLFNANTSSFIMENNNFDYTNRYPDSFIKNYERLIEFKGVTKSKKIQSKINKLIENFDKTYQQIVADLANQRIEYLKSYLNQSRYGLARLYDNTIETDK